MTFKEEYLKLLTRYNIDNDERYVRDWLSKYPNGQSGQRFRRVVLSGLFISLSAIYPTLKRRATFYSPFRTGWEKHHHSHTFI